MAIKVKNTKSNYNFYRSVDGHYNSFWLGKLTNSFVSEGLKHTIEKELTKTYMFTKLHLNVSTFHIFLLKLEKIKPTFKLKSVTIAGKKKDFPVLLPPEKQRNRAVKNMKLQIEKRKEWYLNQRVLNELIDLQSVSNHELFKLRDEALREASKNRFNMRFGY
jgi:ribosomal protein S7